MPTGDKAREAMGLAPAPPAGQQITPLDKRIAETRSMENALRDAVASGLSPQTLIRDAITALRNNPELAQTDRDTFFGAVMTAAQLGLRPNVPSLGHCYILPFRDNRNNRTVATFILGYQGMIELGYASGMVTKIDAHTIYANEPHSIEWGTADRLVHTPVLDRSERGDMIAHYAVVHLKTGQVLWNVISDADARDVMNGSQSKGRFGPWKDDYLPMARKTALRGLWRYMPKTPALALALSTDETVREGVDAEAVPDTAPVGDETTVQQMTPPADVAPETQPAVGVPVDAEVVPVPQDPAQGDNILTATQKSLIKAINDKHGPDWATAAIIATGQTEIYTLDDLDVDQLRATLAVSTAAVLGYGQPI